jgi:hypothetical protein
MATGVLQKGLARDSVYIEGFLKSPSCNAIKIHTPPCQTMALDYGDTFESSSASISIQRSLAATGVAVTIATSRPMENGSNPTISTQESGGKFVGNSIANAQEMIKMHCTQ